MSQSVATPIEPFTVAELLATSLESFMGAAHLHLGGALEDGRKLTERDPQEAWRALLAAAALLNQFEPMMSEEVLLPLQERLRDYLRQLGAQHPDEEFPAPLWLIEQLYANADDADQPVASLEGVVAEAFAELEQES